MGWVHLLPIGSVAVAFILALANRTANHAYLPLEVASVEAIVCIFFMYAYMSVCNATFECWKLAARHYVKGIAEGRWGKFNTGGEDLFPGLGGDPPPIPPYDKDSGTLTVGTETEPRDDFTPPKPGPDSPPTGGSGSPDKGGSGSVDKGGSAPVDPPDGFGPFGDV